MPTNNEELLAIAIPGSCTLKDIKNVVRFHEGYLWKFKSSSISEKLNIVILTAWDDVPPDFDFAAETTQLPEGKTKEWTGRLRYNGTEQTVVVHRG